MSQEKVFTQNKNSTIDNSELDIALKHLYESQTDINRELVIQFLTKAKVIIPINIEGKVTNIDDKELAIDKNTTIQFHLLQNEKEESFCPVFSNTEELAKYTVPMSGTIAQNFMDIAKIVINKDSKIDGIVLNPFGQSLTLNKEIVQKIVNPIINNPAARNYTVAKDEKVLIGEPKNYPEEAVKIIKSVLKNHQCVNKAFLRLMVRPNAQTKNNMSYLLIVDSNDNDLEHLFTDIAQLVKPYTQDVPMDFLKYNENSSFITSAIRDCTPFYKKGGFLGLF